MRRGALDPLFWQIQLDVPCVWRHDSRTTDRAGEGWRWSLATVQPVPVPVQLMLKKLLPAVRAHAVALQVHPLAATLVRRDQGVLLVLHADDALLRAGGHQLSAIRRTWSPRVWQYRPKVAQGHLLLDVEILERQVRLHDRIHFLLCLLRGRAHWRGLRRRRPPGGARAGPHRAPGAGRAPRGRGSLDDEELFHAARAQPAQLQQPRAQQPARVERAGAAGGLLRRAAGRHGCGRLASDGNWGP
mmetsp:Transcript_41386/g.107724  ORF Transcript_41386/g.107724 Transcript_41386/m.107724 type:complete len:244 (+) Transcript_41386:895-1626(+)